jgi:hypothetical protein
VKTEPLKEVRALGAKELPVIVDPDARVWLCRAGDALVVGGRDDQPVPADKPASFSPARFDAVWKRAAEHFPALSSAKWEAKSNVLTPFSFDGLPLVGPAEIEGLWFSCGFSDLGPAAASVSAEILARWMVEGKTDLDRSLEARRTGAHVKSPGFVAARAAECRARGDELAYPHREHQSARKLKQTSLARKLSELGAVWGEADGWERPNWFAWNEAAGDDAIVPQGWAAKNWSPAIAAEQIACRRAAALFDLSSSAKEEQCRLGLWGPAAPDIVRAASGDDFSEEGFPAGSSKRVKLGGLTPLLIRTSLVGETGWELWTEMKSGPKLFDALWEAGRPFGLLAAGFRALDALVIENGLPGLVRLELEDPAQICLGGEAVCERGRMVGRVIRAAYAAASNKSIAYAELNDFQSKPGTKLEIDLFGERAPAVVVA